MTLFQSLVSKIMDERVSVAMSWQAIVRAARVVSSIVKKPESVDACPSNHGGAQLLKVGISLYSNATSGASSRPEPEAWGSALLGFRLCCAGLEPQRIGAGIKPPPRGRATTGALSRRVWEPGKHTALPVAAQRSLVYWPQNATIERWMPAGTHLSAPPGRCSSPVPLTSSPGKPARV